MSTAQLAFSAPKTVDCAVQGELPTFKVGVPSPEHYPKYSMPTGQPNLDNPLLGVSFQGSLGWLESYTQ